MGGAKFGASSQQKIMCQMLCKFVPNIEVTHKYGFTVRFPMGVADPVEAIKFRMEQQGLTQKDLEPFIGSSDRVSEVLNHKRRLSLKMVKRLHDGLRIPYESLLAAA